MSFEQDHERRYENLRQQSAREAAQKYGGFAANMTLRQHYAAMAMIGFIVTSDESSNKAYYDDVASDAFEQADAMIRYEQKEKETK